MAVRRTPMKVLNSPELIKSIKVAKYSDEKAPTDDSIRGYPKITPPCRAGRGLLAAPQEGVFTLGRPGGKKDAGTRPAPSCCPPRGWQAARIRRAQDSPQE